MIISKVPIIQSRQIDRNYTNWNKKDIIRDIQINRQKNIHSYNIRPTNMDQTNKRT